MSYKTILRMINSKHFQIEQLDEGVFAATHQHGGMAISNAGILDLGDRTIIFDSFLTPQAAIDLNLAAEALTDRPVSIVVNSHYHNDHIWGNQVFNPETDFISSAETRRLISTAGLDEYHWYKEHAAQELQTLEEKSEPEQVSDNPQLSQLWHSYYCGVIEALPRIKLRPPNLVFDERLSIHGSRRSAHLLSFHGGHTNSDTVLFLPDCGIIFGGDLLSFNTHPYLPDGMPGKLPDILKSIEQMNPTRMVPGHGPVGNMNNLEKLLQYLESLDQIAYRLVQKDASVESISKVPIPKAYHDWELSNFFESNLRFYYQQQIQAQFNPDEPVHEDHRDTGE